MLFLSKFIVPFSCRTYPLVFVRFGEIESDGQKKMAESRLSGGVQAAQMEKDKTRRKEMGDIEGPGVTDQVRVNYRLAKLTTTIVVVDCMAHCFCHRKTICVQKVPERVEVRSREVVRA